MLLIQLILVSVIDLDTGDTELKLKDRKIYCLILSFVILLRFLSSVMSHPEDSKLNLLLILQ